MMIYDQLQGMIGLLPADPAIGDVILYVAAVVLLVYILIFIIRGVLSVALHFFV